MKELGIDISRWQGDFNLAQAKAEGVNFAILKGAGGDSGLYVDSKFERNYEMAKSIGMPIGSYFYSGALSCEEAVREAEYYYTYVLKGRQFELPIYIDVEDSKQLSLGKRAVTDIIKAFCSCLEAKGYWVGIYTSLSSFQDRMFDDELQCYAHWVAQWSTNCSYNKSSIGLWQFGGETNYLRSKMIAGQVVDQDYLLVDYPTQIKALGKNGYAVEVEETEEDNFVADKISVQTVVDIALAEIGYLEKASNSDLESKEGNAGYNNWTKYAAHLDNLGDFYNGKKNGYAWCDMFVDWCFVTAFGEDKALKALCQPRYSAGASCSYSMNYYKQAGRFSNEPNVGDQIFFYYDGGVNHTGIVVAVSDNYVTTVEGNTSSGSGVIPNGGGVFKRTYQRSYSAIAGYGHPVYDNNQVDISASVEHIDTQPIKTAPSKILTVQNVQQYLNAVYNSELVEDGVYGQNTKKALIKAIQTTIGVDADGVFGNISKSHWNLLRLGSEGEQVRLLQCMLICIKIGVGSDGADGIYGGATFASIKTFQRNAAIYQDGEAGQQTAYCMFR